MTGKYDADLARKQWSERSRCDIPGDHKVKHHFSLRKRMMLRLLNLSYDYSAGCYEGRLLLPGSDKGSRGMTGKSWLLPCPGCKRNAVADDGHYICRACEGYKPKPEEAGDVDPTITSATVSTEPAHPSSEEAEAQYPRVKRLGRARVTRLGLVGNNRGYLGWTWEIAKERSSLALVIPDQIEAAIRRPLEEERDRALRVRDAFREAAKDLSREKDALHAKWIEELELRCDAEVRAEAAEAQVAKLREALESVKWHVVPESVVGMIVWRALAETVQEGGETQ